MAPVSFTAIEGSVCGTFPTSWFTLVAGTHVNPPSVDFEKYTSLVPRRVSVQTMKISFRASSARDDSVWDAPPASSFTRTGTLQVRPPFADLVKKTSVPVTALLHAEKETYTTPSLPTAREGWLP